MIIVNSWDSRITVTLSNEIKINIDDNAYVNRLLHKLRNVYVIATNHAHLYVIEEISPRTKASNIQKFRY